MSSSLQGATVAVNSVTHTGGLSISPLIVSAVCAVLASVSGCWYPRQPTLTLLTPYCLTLPRNNPHPTVSFKSCQPYPSQPLCPPTSFPSWPFCHMQASNLQCLFVLRYPWTAGYSVHVEHGINAGLHPCSFPNLNPTTVPHLPFPAEEFILTGSGVLPSSSRRVWRTFYFVTEG